MQFLQRWFKRYADCPAEADLKRWAWSEWVEYQAWLFHNSFVSVHEWQVCRREVLRWSRPPLISIVTPVYNTQPFQLRECIHSVRSQIYPYWELCLVDDGSSNEATRQCLQTLIADERRIRLLRLEKNQGICHATNTALAMAQGKYVAFLDHDDRLAPDALYLVVKALREEPTTDFIYSDRDLLAPQDFRFMHLLKPGWSPENLFTSNYTCHLTVYRYSLLQQVDGVHAEFEGSQDHDLVLRIAELKPHVQHIPKILYHWRQHEYSVALHHAAKEYAYQAAQRAIRAALQRRGLKGQVSEMTSLWRGNYRVQLEPPPVESYALIQLKNLENYAQQINQAFAEHPQVDTLVILGPNVQPIEENSIPELVAWLQIAEVGLVTGKVLDPQQHLLHAGLVLRPSGIPLTVYAGHPEGTPGYMAVTATVRNVSIPHPACCAIKRGLWQTLQGFNPDYPSVYALFDFALRALHNQHRVVYTAFARFLASTWETPESWSLADRQRFVAQWQTWLTQGDPYYHPGLTLELADMGLHINNLEKENPTN